MMIDEYLFFNTMKESNGSASFDINKSSTQKRNNHSSNNASGNQIGSILLDLSPHCTIFCSFPNYDENLLIQAKVYIVENIFKPVISISIEEYLIKNCGNKYIHETNRKIKFFRTLFISSPEYEYSIANFQQDDIVLIPSNMLNNLDLLLLETNVVDKNTFKKMD